MTPTSAGRPLAAAAALLGGAALVWVAAFRIGFGASVDEDVLSGFLDLRTPRTHDLAVDVVRFAHPRQTALLAAGIVGVALVRRRWHLALAAAVAIAGANLTTQALKRLTAEPRAVESLPGAHIAAESWPSGHATAAISIALCLVAVAPARLRVLAAAPAGGLAAGVACSVMVLGWHLPSDVLAAFLVAAAWALGAFATLGRPRSAPYARLPAARKAISRISGRQATGERGTQ